MHHSAAAWNVKRSGHAPKLEPTNLKSHLQTVGSLADEASDMGAFATSRQRVNLPSAGDNIEGTSDVTLVRREMHEGPRS